MPNKNELSLFDILDYFKNSDMTSLKVESGDLKVSCKREITVAATPMKVPTVANNVVSTTPNTTDNSQTEYDNKTISGNALKSPIVGTFYSASSPDAKPFVSVGDKVCKGDVVCIIEAMKVMNEIESEFDGVVKQILVSNGDVVEFDTPIMIIE